ncbi:murein L,D-transpeptidase catalytic domain family protein [Roseibacterium beibuensis]|uniref:L,D-transpeptidase catalytic domain n=1 Tax=[Roseibacterium] beibuensis TaxID=1193142 RepID=A0ABP9LT51_9RHOB|nr:murein L,D-transpeptidase catalytic domain family protein [Roseibacterium beibuensis]MCS6627929.1 murein L,D-transpeptidase catalytic domain family protein [Roseibacterium beibuensis]
MIRWTKRLTIAALGALAAAAPMPAEATPLSAEIPSWLQQHVGTGEGQIAPVVLERARALYMEQVRGGGIQNPCYLAMDATRPSSSSTGGPGQRFYIICEAEESFRAVSSGYGSGRSLPAADFSNERECAQNFSNAEGSNLTMGGAYLTAETRTSFKGYFTEDGERVPFHRTFLLFDGMGETDNAREREIGGHVAMFLRWQCRFSAPDSPDADAEGYVPYGNLVNYTGGRSNGCTTWSEEVAEDIMSRVEGDPTTLYIYPESGDITAVADAVAGQRPLSEEGLYWNATCLGAIGSPRFWTRETLRPIIDQWRASLPEPAPLELPICP